MPRPAVRARTSGVIDDVLRGEGGCGSGGAAQTQRGKRSCDPLPGTGASARLRDGNESNVMNTSNCTAPIGFSELIEYWFDELDEAAGARIDEHLFGCQECGAKLDEIIALAGGVRAAFGQGVVRAFVTNAFVTGLVEQGVHLREYRVPCNGSVNCSVAPEDEVLVARLEAPLGGVTRLDAHSYIGDAQ